MFCCCFWEGLQRGLCELGMVACMMCCVYHLPDGLHVAGIDGGSTGNGIIEVGGGVCSFAAGRAGQT